MALQVHARLRQQIVCGVLRPMQRLSEQELAEQLGISRTPVREALGKLEEEGLVIIRSQFGTFVAPISVEEVGSSQFIREALECAAVRQAALRCTVADRSCLLEILKRQRAAVGDTAFFEADDLMHRSLMVTAGQAPAWRVVHGAKATIDRVRYLSVQHPPKRRAILVEHRRIIQAVIAGDPVAASEAMQDHLRGVFESTQRMLRQHGEFFGSDAEVAMLKRSCRTDG